MVLFDHLPPEYQSLKQITASKKDDEDFGGLFEFDDDPSENLTKLCIARYVKLPCFHHLKRYWPEKKLYSFAIGEKV